MDYKDMVNSMKELCEMANEDQEMYNVDTDWNKEVEEDFVSQVPPSSVSSSAPLPAPSPAFSSRIMFEEFTSPPRSPSPLSSFVLQQLVDAAQIQSSPSPQKEKNETEQDEMELDDEDEDTDEDGILFGSLDKARKVTIDLMKQLKEEFGADVAKQLIVESAKAAGVALHGNRDTSIRIDVPLDDMRLRLQSFSTATLQIKQRENGTNLIDRCVEIMVQLEVAHLIEEADEDEKSKELNVQLQKALKIDSSTQYSKFKRKCSRVKKLCDVLGVAGGCALGMYIKIYAIENMINVDFKTMIVDLKSKTELLNFCKTLQVSRDGMPMLALSV
ncbi:hypothetical protein HMPREF1544_02653 [Mucor circinelloides 1006PhL]|uniref:Uncharacterized protein n=1 Tax=Mucor circinelloides f. circinelloides (strain 1006PhL) TaxID=1220926 RepID=S2KDP3_MUCC1|nr:hypothetical protein HMPREF1544_02653 [Mucor circinelloides 1006PhL]KAG1091467.1 hypothetical protein G6F42_019423 [Rhizopus arrhizus]